MTKICEGFDENDEMIAILAKITKNRERVDENYENCFSRQTRRRCQFREWWWHGHDCHRTKGKEINEKRKKHMKELLKETKANSKYIRDQGYNLVELWECEWRRLKKTSSQVQRFIDSKFRRPLDNHKTLTEAQILSAIRNESLFGVVECDIRVPDSLKPVFAEMPPIFKNTDISRDDIGEYMKAFAEKQKIMSRPRRSLIGSYFGGKILLATPLTKWYLEHGLEATHIYQVIECTPMPCFKPFGEAVSDARRAGDVDPNKAIIVIIADTMKLVNIILSERSFFSRQGKISFENFNLAFLFCS